MRSLGILLLGGGGYVGSRYRSYLDANGMSYAAPGRTELDYTIPGRLAAHLKENAYEFLICAAGYTGKPNVDACEIHKHETLLGNAVLPGIVAEACVEVGLPFGYVSSGCIYNGKREDGGGFTEEDLPNFCFREGDGSFYSGTKALGEEVLSNVPLCYIWRLRIPFSHEDGPRNYISKLMRYNTLLEAENSVSHIDEFVEATLECWKKDLDFGIYNVTNPGSITTKRVVELILESGVSSKEYRFFDSEEDFMEKAANTPRSNCVLDVSKLLDAGVSLRPVEDAVKDALDKWIPEKL